MTLNALICLCDEFSGTTRGLDTLGLSALWHALAPVEKATPPLGRECSMFRVLVTLSLLLLLLPSRVGAQATDSSFTLTLPVRDDGPQALATLEIVVVDMGGHLKREKGSPTVVDAAWDASTLVQGILTPKLKGQSTSAQWQLALTCAKGAGGAKALCQEVERRYREQYH